MAQIIPIKALTDDDIIWFGKHKGKKIKDVEASYLDWWMGAEGTQKTIALYKYCIENKEVIEKEMEDDQYSERVASDPVDRDEMDTPF